MIVNHFNSKGGDQPLFGRFQPPARPTEVQRHQQAQLVNDFVDEILAAFKNARIVVLGDINDFEFSQTVEILKGDVLTNLMDTLPKSRAVLLCVRGQLAGARPDPRQQQAGQALAVDYDVVHVNAEFFDQACDHDPQVARFLFDDDD